MIRASALCAGLPCAALATLILALSIPVHAATPSAPPPRLKAVKDPTAPAVKPVAPKTRRPPGPTGPPPVTGLPGEQPSKSPETASGAGGGDSGGGSTVQKQQHKPLVVVDPVAPAGTATKVEPPAAKGFTGDTTPEFAGY